VKRLFQFSPSKRKDYHLKSQAIALVQTGFNLVPPKGRIITSQHNLWHSGDLWFQFSPSKRKDYHFNLKVRWDGPGSFNLVPPKGRIITWLPAPQPRL